MTADTAVAAPAKGSRWEDLVDIYFSPAELFERRREDPWWKPFLLLSVIVIVLYYVFLPINAVLWEAVMLENARSGTDPEQIRRSAQVMKYLGGIFVPFNLAFVIALTAVGLKFGSALLEPAARWAEAFTIAAYASFVMIVQQVIGTLLVFMRSRSSAVSMRDASFGVLRFVEKPDPVLRTVLGRLDLFAIWSAVLCAVGLVVIVRMSRVKAIITSAIAWLLIALPGLAGAALFRRK